MVTEARRASGVLAAFTVSLVLLLQFAQHDPAYAQTCWAYTDGQTARAPVRCVQQGNLSASCSWNPACHTDGDPSDCCTSIPASTPQTIREMHESWHQCFGAVGVDNGNNPPGRGSRWYAFHRQFEIDFNEWRESAGVDPIESLQWCPGMNLPIGHHGAGLAPGDHPAGCGVGPGRPDDTPCPGCEAFPQCMFLSGAGPALCPAAPGATCGRPGPGGFDLSYDSLEEFPDVEEVTKVLDAYFHADMHGAIVTPAGVNGDSNSPACSPRDPMFWRLHKAIDDVVRAWQDQKAVDVVLVLDTSGSMSGADSTGISKLNAAVNAADLFADLLEEEREDGEQNRIGVVTYSSGATTRLPLTTVSPGFRAPGGDFSDALAAILTGGPGGCTGIGAGIERALELLCPPDGNCEGFSAADDNDRKAIVLLTDGLENRPPCLNPSGPGPSTACSSRCFGSSLDYAGLGLTQLVSVGFGDSGSLNGPVLTLLSERQGGVYLQNPNDPGNDLKHFYVKAMGTVSGEAVMIDPEGLLGASEPASPRISHQSCGAGESQLTFSSVWDKKVEPGNLRLLVTAPNGDLVRGTAPAVDRSTEALWSHLRIRLPYKGLTTGKWHAELIRPHRIITNGFSPTAFKDPEAGTRLIRREIHRLCPEGCGRVLRYEAVPAEEDEKSAYEYALEAEVASGIVKEVVTAGTDEEFTNLLAKGKWDLILYAQTGPDKMRIYDQMFSGILCRKDTRAIIADSRWDIFSSLYECAGASHTGEARWRAVVPDGPAAGMVELRDPGNQQESWALRAREGAGILATGAGTEQPAIIATFAEGEEQNWSINILGRGLSKLTPVSLKSKWKTDDTIRLAARILPSYVRKGGYDSVNARVEVEYPTEGLGAMLSERRHEEDREFSGERVDGPLAPLQTIKVPTRKTIIELNDDGVDGDTHANNFYWTGILKGIPIVDGHYKLRYIFDLTADGCTTRREANQSIIVEVGIDPERTRIESIPFGPDEDGSRRLELDIFPRDRLGNLLGPGRAGPVSCAPRNGCDLAGRVQDLGNGGYRIVLNVGGGIPGVQLEGLGARFDIAVPCEDCPGLKSFSLSEDTAGEHDVLEGRIELDRSSADRATTVFIRSTDPRLIPVPASVTVPVGEDSVSFTSEIGHLIDRQEKSARIIVTLGGQRKTSRILVTKEQDRDEVTAESDLPRWLWPALALILLLLILLLAVRRRRQ